MDATNPVPTNAPSPLAPQYPMLLDSRGENVLPGLIPVTTQQYFQQVQQLPVGGSLAPPPALIPQIYNQGKVFNDCIASGKDARTCNCIAYGIC